MTKEQNRGRRDRLPWVIRGGSIRSGWAVTGLGHKFNYNLSQNKEVNALLKGKKGKDHMDKTLTEILSPG